MKGARPANRFRRVVAKLSLSALALFVAAAAAASVLQSCGSAGGKAAGESCSTSSECGPGLVCDLGKSSPVCADFLTVRPDAARIDASFDASEEIDANLPDARQPDSSVGDSGTD